MAATWSDPPPAPRRLVVMRFEVDDRDDVEDAQGHERLARIMEAHAHLGARWVGAVVRSRQLYVDRRGELREIATLDDEDRTA